jgi:hypothetical protein
MGRANHIGSTQKAKLKIKYDFVVKVLDLSLSTYLPRCHMAYYNWPNMKLG